MNKIKIKPKDGKKAKTVVYKYFINDLADKNIYHFTLPNGKELKLNVHEFVFVFKVKLDA